MPRAEDGPVPYRLRLREEGNLQLSSPRSSLSPALALVLPASLLSAPPSAAQAPPTDRCKTDKGRTSPVREIEVPVRVPRERLREALARQAGYVVKLQLRPGKNWRAATVLDGVGKVSSTVAASYPPRRAGGTRQEGAR
jgi:hypothetical protein